MNVKLADKNLTALLSMKAQGEEKVNLLHSLVGLP